jgi:hypothetical protein
MSFDYRHGYEYELAHRENLHGALGTPITVVSLLGASVGEKPPEEIVVVAQTSFSPE